MYHPIKKITILALMIACSPFLFGQNEYQFEPSGEHPFGMINPDAPKELMDYAPLIGECECKSVSRIDQNTWADTVLMTWRWKYIMNGWGVQDETLKADGKHSGSIRQFIPDSSRWFVHYYSSAGPSAQLRAWEGNRNDDGDIVLYNDQSAPNGTEGWFKITFSDISNEGFNWLGEWTTKDESFTYPTWKIFCQKKNQDSRDADRAALSRNILAFSQAYVDGNAEAMANSYTRDGKIFPGNSDVISGTAALTDFWTLSEGRKVLRHKISPVSIYFQGDYAYDYGYYEGASQNAEGEESSFKGKYVVVWKKEDGNWKMDIDIWNGLPK